MPSAMSKGTILIVAPKIHFEYKSFVGKVQSHRSITGDEIRLLLLSAPSKARC